MGRKKPVAFYPEDMECNRQAQACRSPAPMEKITMLYTTVCYVNQIPGRRDGNFGARILALMYAMSASWNIWKGFKFRRASIPMYAATVDPNSLTTYAYGRLGWTIACLSLRHNLTFYGRRVVSNKLAWPAIN